jgi:hypothetical protein
LIYNTINFGNPLLSANLAGDFSDTFFKFGWQNLAAKADFYGRMVSQFVPIVWVGLLGLAFFPRRLRREQVVLCASLVALLAYVLNIETIGGCQYGPRYLLPAMPFAALGLIGISHLAHTMIRRAALILAGAAGAFSALVNLLGGLYGTMYCDLRRYAFAHYLAAIQHRVFREYPLALWLLIPLGLWCIQLVALVFSPRPLGGEGQGEG